MRSIYILVFLLLALNCFSQENNGISVKHDSMVPVGNDLAVLYKKSKSALYDIGASKFRLPYQKEYIHYFEKGHTLISISENGDIKEYDLRNGFTDSTEVKKHFSRYMIEESLEFSCTAFNEDLIIIHDYSYPHNYSYPLLNVYGEDSIDQNGNVVYPAPEPEACNSGVFNTKTGKWEIDPLYRSVHQMNDDIFVFHGQKEGDTKKRVDWYEYKDKSFALHKTFLKKNIELKEKKKILSKSLSLDSVQKVPGTNSRYYLYKEGKAGLASFDILSETSLFVYEEHSPLEFDLVIYHPGSRSIVEYDGENFQYYSDREEESDSIIDFSTYFRINDFTESEYSVFTGREAKFSSENHSNFAVQLIGQYAMVSNITPQFVYDFPLHTEYGSDSIDENANLVYPDPIPGVYSSGVFDLEKKKWIISPEHKDVLSIGEEHFLANDLSLDSSGLTKDEPYIQTVYDDGGEIIARIADFKNSTPIELARKILPGDTIYYSAYQYLPVSLLEDSVFEHDNVFFIAEKNDKMKVYRMKLGYENQILAIDELKNDFSEFILPVIPSAHGDFPSPLMFNFMEKNGGYQVNIDHPISELKETSIMAKTISSPGLFEVVYPNGIRYFKDDFVKLIYKDSSYSNNVSLGVVIEKKDTLIQMVIDTTEYNSLLKSFYSPIRYRIFHTTDKIVIQNSPQEYYMTVLFPQYGENYTEISRSIYFERENNSVWSNVDGQWSKQGESYASLKQTPYGYIARTAEIRNEVESFFIEDIGSEVYDSLKGALRDKQPEYKLLDTSFTPFTYESKSTFSAIEYHSFGYQVFINPDQSILINLNGDLLSEEHFESYYEEDGVLYGENTVRYKIDPETGFYLNDDEGDFIILREAEKRKIDR